MKLNTYTQMVFRKAIWRSENDICNSDQPGLNISMLEQAVLDVDCSTILFRVARGRAVHLEMSFYPFHLDIGESLGSLLISISIFVIISIY